MRTIVIKVPPVGHGCAQNTHKHWTKTRPDHVDARNEGVVGYLLADGSNKTQFSKAQVSVQWFQGPGPYYKPLDIQNAIGALKYTIDGIVVAGLLPDDSHKHLTWGPVELIRTKKACAGRNGIELTFTEVE